MSVKNSLIGVVTLAGVIYMSTMAHSQTVDPMRAACANSEFAERNQSVCENLANAPYTPPTTYTQTSAPHAYWITPHGTAVPFYGTYDQCVSAARRRHDEASGLTREGITSDPKLDCFPAQ